MGIRHVRREPPLALPRSAGQDEGGEPGCRLVLHPLTPRPLPPVGYFFPCAGRMRLTMLLASVDVCLAHDSVHLRAASVRRRTAGRRERPRGTGCVPPHPWWRLADLLASAAQKSPAKLEPLQPEDPPCASQARPRRSPPCFTDTM